MEIAITKSHAAFLFIILVLFSVLSGYGLQPSFGQEHSKSILNTSPCGSATDYSNFTGTLHAISGFTSPSRLSEGSNFHPNYQQIAVARNNMYIVWTQQSLPAINGNEVPDYLLFKASRDEGASFSKTVMLTNNTENPEYPQITASQNNVYIAWFTHGIGQSKMLFRASHDGGQTFGPEINIDQGGVEEGIANSPLTNKSGYHEISSVVLAASGNNVYVVWVDNFSGQLHLLLTSSNNKGESFNLPIELNSKEPNLGKVQIATMGKNVYLTWYASTKVYFAASYDRGVSFEPAIQLSDYLPSDSPQIQTSGVRNVYVMWKSYEGVGAGAGATPYVDYWFAKSENQGRSFEQNRIAQEQLNDGQFIMASSAKNVYIAWLTVYRTFSIIISHDHGATFAPAVGTDIGFSDFSEPLIAAYKSVVDLAWPRSSFQNFSQSILMSKLSRDAGDHFTSAIKLNCNDGFENVGSPSTAIGADGAVYIVWSATNSTNNYLYIARSLLESGKLSDK